MPRKFDPQTLYAPIGQYHNAVEVRPKERLIFSSGIIGCTPDGILIPDPEGQIEQAWANVKAFLDGCGFGPENLVRLKMHLTDRDHLPISRAARVKTLGEPMHAAVTGVIVGLFDPDLYIEIDVVAAG
jgi:enamine deaminase RidA (YjgF/YER057c/UK114 family)